ncbi:MAG: PFL family protein [Planctomycetes bacterium]|nr:PFL family protein [Planctomycetota bacterium]
MLRTEDIMTTLRMFQEENLDVRTVTLGINLLDCADPDIKKLCRKIDFKIRSRAGKLVRICEEIGNKYGIPVVNKRLAVTPISAISAGGSETAFVDIAHALDSAAEEVGVDLVGGFSALVQKGMTPPEEALIRAIPVALSQTDRVCSSVNVASTAAGINMDAARLAAEQVLKLAQATSERDGFGAAKLSIFANIPDDNPFMAGAVLGHGEPDCVVNIGVSGPGVVKRSVERLCSDQNRPNLGEVAEQIKKTSFRVTRVGELIGREVADRVGADFGIVDLSLAPTPRVGDSVGEILHAMGIKKIGSPGSTAAIALLNDAVKKGGLFASSSVGGLSGAFIPVSEDKSLAEAARNGDLSLEKLEAMSSVCSVGLDMVVLPGDTSASTIAALVADEAAIGVINRKTTSVRVIPVPGKKAGEIAHFGGLFGESVAISIRAAGSAETFVNRGGRIPAPLQSLNN